MHRKQGFYNLSAPGWCGLLFLCAAFGGCALGLIPLSADPIDSQVVDADTGMPIEGAVVLAYWELHTGSFAGDSLPCGAANVEDAVTDKDGRFHIPGWGPTTPGCSGEMREGNPYLYVFKPGYHYIDVPNGMGSIHNILTTRNAWKDRQLKLNLIKDINFRSNRSEALLDFAHFETSMGFLTEGNPTECNWKKAPNMIRALAIQRQAIISGGYDYYGIVGELIHNDDWYQRKALQCGSPKKFIEDLLK